LCGSEKKSSFLVMKKLITLFVLLVAATTFGSKTTAYPEIDKKFTVRGTEKTYTVALDRSAVWDYSKNSEPLYYSGRISLSRSSSGSSVPGRDFSFGLRSSSLNEVKVEVAGADEKFATKLPWQLKLSNKRPGIVEMKLFLGGNAITEKEGKADYTQEISRTDLATCMDEFFVFVRSSTGETATVSVGNFFTSTGWINPAAIRSSSVVKSDSERSSKPSAGSVVGVVGLWILLLLSVRRSEV